MEIRKFLRDKIKNYFFYTDKDKNYLAFGLWDRQSAIIKHLWYNIEKKIDMSEDEIKESLEKINKFQTDMEEYSHKGIKILQEEEK